MSETSSGSHDNNIIKTYRLKDHKFNYLYICIYNYEINN